MNLSLFTPEVLRFINEYEQGDPFILILSKKKVNGIPAKILAEQVIACQKIKIKAPEWYKASELIYPSVKAVEPQIAAVDISGDQRKIFRVNHIYQMCDFFRKKPVNRPSVITRNFPFEVNEIRSHYLFL